MQDQINKFISQYESTNTKKSYTTILNRFNKWAGGVIPDGNQWTKEYTHFLFEKKLGNKTINTSLVTIGNFIKYATGRTTEYDRLKETTREVEFLSEPEIEKLLGASNKQLRAIWMFMLDTGVRVGELKAISEVQYNEIPSELSIMGKGSKQRLIVISDATQGLIGQVWDKGYLFGRPVSEKQIQYQLVKLSEVVGRHLHPHQIRHAFATRMLNLGADITEIQKMLGHAYLATTQIYTHVTDAKLRETWKKYHNRK